VLAVAQPWWSVFPGLAGAAYELQRSTVCTLQRAVAELTDDVSVEWLVSYDPAATALRREAARQGSDAIVIGEHRRRWHGWLERSLRRRAPAPVIAVPA
jgi:nucleotide-binding universal stress UspA family protein